MSDHSESPQRQIESYLAALRKQLDGLPAEDVEEILQELRGHIAERVKETESGQSAAGVAQLLDQFGTPQQIGSLYRAEALAASARAGFSPALIVRATLRVASRTGVGFLALMAGFVGYVLGGALIICAILKPFLPAYVGLWINPGGMVLGAEMPQPHGQELLGWWLIPYGLGVGLAFLIGTTVFLRWMLRFVPRSARRAASPA